MSVRDLMALWLQSYALAFRSLVASRPSGVKSALSLALVVPGLLVVQLVHWIGFALDELFFRKYRDVEITEPLFVVGMPRSGTSFLHATLADDRERFTTTKLWELLLAPSITERRFWHLCGRVDALLGRPAVRLARWVERTVQRRMDGAHPVDLEAPGEDFLLLLPAWSSFLLVAVFPVSPAIWNLTRVDAWPDKRRRRLLRFYKSCLQRHVYARGDFDRVVLSKNPSFTACISTLRETFPDARFLVCFRDPSEAIPSQLSSLRAGVEGFGYDPADPLIRDRFVSMYEHFARHALETLGGEPGSRARFVAFPALTADTEGTVRSAYRTFGWTPAEAYGARLAEVAERSRGHRSSHRYRLDEFGLQERYLHDLFDEPMARLHTLSSHEEGARA